MSSTPTGRTVHRLSADGDVMDWLTGPLWEWPCDDLEETVSASGSPWSAPDGLLPRWRLTNGPDAAPVKSALYARHPLLTDQATPDPRAGSPLRWTVDGTERQGTLRRVRADAEGLVDWSGFARTPQYRTAIAVASIEIDQAERRRLEVRSTGPLAVWIDGEPVGRFDDFSYMVPITHTIDADLRSGTTTIVVESWQVAFRECRHVVGLRVVGPPASVVVNDDDADEFSAGREEARLAAVSAESPVSVDGRLRLHGEPGTSLAVHIDEASVPQIGGGRSVDLDFDAVADFDDAGLAELDLPPVDAGRFGLPYEATVTLCDPDSSNGLTRAFEISCVRNVPYRSEAPSDVGSEAAGAAAPAAAPSASAEIVEYARALPPSPARALAVAHDGGRIRAVDVAEAIDLIESRGDCADFEALALLLLLARVPREKWDDGVAGAVDTALLDFKYWIDQPGLDAMCYFTENHQFVWHVAEMLAGARYAEHVFTNSGLLGREHHEHGRRLALAWIDRKLDGGFSEFESNAYVAINCFSLAVAVELGDAEVARRSRALLDLVLCTLATAAWRGIHATAHGRSYTRMLRSARMEETGPLLWLSTGMGSLNPAVLPALTIATSPVYELPDIVRSISLAAAGDWSYETVNRGRLDFELDLLDRPYRSVVSGAHLEDAAIGAVEDYRVGTAGLQEHVWTIALGPETQVFATLAGAASRSGDVRPNAWSGNLVIPRARLHGTSLVALYASAPVGAHGLHLWFPAPHFDDVVEAGPWLCGRRGSGYVAVGTEGGFEAAAHGPEPRHEWFPRGRGRWVTASIGSLEQDGGFAEFIERLGAVDFEVDPYDGSSVHWRPIDGDELELDDVGRFTVNGRVEDRADLRLRSAAVAARSDDDVVHLRLNGSALDVPVR